MINYGVAKQSNRPSNQRTVDIYRTLLLFLSILTDPNGYVAHNSSISFLLSLFFCFARSLSLLYLLLQSFLSLLSLLSRVTFPLGLRKSSSDVRYLSTPILAAVTVLFIIEFFWYSHWLCIDIQTIQCVNFNSLNEKPDF